MASKRDNLKFLKVRPRDQGGAFAVIKPNELSDIMDGSKISEWEIHETWMPEAKFEELPDHGGW